MGLAWLHSSARGSRSPSTFRSICPSQRKHGANTSDESPTTTTPPERMSVSFPPTKSLLWKEGDSAAVLINFGQLKKKRKNDTKSHLPRPTPQNPGNPSHCTAGLDQSLSASANGAIDTDKTGIAYFCHTGCTLYEQLEDVYGGSW